MKNTIVLLACAASPFFLTGCEKSCEDLEREMGEIGREIAGDFDRAEELAGKIEDLQEEYFDRCVPG